MKLERVSETGAGRTETDHFYMYGRQETAEVEQVMTTASPHAPRTVSGIFYIRIRAQKELTVFYYI